MRNLAAGPEPVKIDHARSLSDMAVDRFWANVDKGNRRHDVPPWSPAPGGFWSRVDCSGGPGACWPWIPRARARGGYGSVDVNGRSDKAHRLAWELTHGPIPNKLWVLHRCDNPPCCNPAHLFLGTNADNVADRKAKGRTRAWRGPRPDYRRCVTFEMAKEIRSRLAAGATCGQVAKEYNISRQHVSSIKNGKRWSEQPRTEARAPSVRPLIEVDKCARPLDLVEHIYTVVEHNPWLSIAEIAARLGIEADRLRVPMRYLRGLDDRGVPSTRPVRVQTIGGRKWRRYAAVGVPLPASATQQEARADG